jgi:hypothetical protein
MPTNRRSIDVAEFEDSDDGTAATLLARTDASSGP